MEEIMIGSIPMGSVCIGLTEYRELLESKTRAESLEKETEAAYNRGFAEGKTAAYEEYLTALVARKKKIAAHRAVPDKTEARNTKEPAPANLAETVDAITEDKPKTAGKKEIENRVKAKICQARLQGKSAASIAETYGLGVSTVYKILDAAPAQVKRQWARG